MKNNQPVTSHEVLLRSDCSIISHTNSKGIITYVNDDFIEYSGFTRDEVIGKNHNIIRHAALAEQTLCASRSIQDIVVIIGQLKDQFNTEVKH